MWYPNIDDKTYMILTEQELGRQLRECRGHGRASRRPARPRLFAARDAHRGPKAWQVLTRWLIGKFRAATMRPGRAHRPRRA